MHNRKLLLGGVALTMARLRPAKAVAAAANKVRDDLEREIVQFNYLDRAPFKWVGLIIREGLVDEAEPHYRRIDPEDGELHLAIEIDVRRLLGRSQEEMDTCFASDRPHGHVEDFALIIDRAPRVNSLPRCHV